MSADAVPDLIRKLYALVAELEAQFPGRKFTLDGHLVGSIGEVLAAHRYGLTLLPASTPDHDAVSADGRLIQIKATQAGMVGLRAQPEHLLVIGLQPDGSFTELYNGTGSKAWEAAGKMQRNGQRPISTSKLAKLMDAGAGRPIQPVRP